MSEWEWEPGDVAHGISKYVKGRLLIRAYDATWLDLDGERYEGNLDARPLVVIDPEDAEQVRKLALAYDEKLQERFPDEYNTWPDVPPGDDDDLMQAALREFARPTPRIEEPQGLGAVVEDADGERWIRTERAAYLKKPWQGSIAHVHWSRINAVRVLSHGVAEGAS